MNTKQRIYFTSVITAGIPITIILAFVLDRMMDTNVVLSAMFSSVIVVPLVYFLSFKVWDKTEQVSGEDIKLRTDTVINRGQRILLALVIALVFPVNILLGIVLDGLTGEYLEFWMLIPSSIIVAIGVYFISFLIWGKTKQEVDGGKKEPVQNQQD